MEANFILISKTFSLGLFPLLASTFAQAQLQVYTDLSSFSYSESLPLYQVATQSDAIFRFGNRAFTHNKIEIGALIGNWKIATLARYDYSVNLHPGSPLQQFSANGQLRLNSKNTITDDYLSHTQAWGIKVGYGWQISNSFKISSDLSLLQANAIQDGTSTGTQGNNNSNEPYSEIDVDYYYSEDLISQKEVEPTYGYGYTFDLNLNWQAFDWLELTAQFHDLYSRLYWHDIAYTQAKVTTNTLDFDDEGHIITQPTLAGIEGYTDHVQKLPVRIQSELSLQALSYLQLNSGLYYEQELILPHLGLSLLWNGGYFNVNYQFTSEASGIIFQHGGFKLNVRSDSLDYQLAHSLEAGLSYIYSW